MKISLIILSWNTNNLLRDCLRSVDSKDVFEIIVVDNNSTDGSWEMVEKEFPKVKLIKNKKNLGFAKGNNQGIRVAGGDLVMLLNSDTVVQKGAIEKLVDFYEEQKDKNLALSPLLLNPDGTVQKEYYMRFPSLWQIFFYHHPLGRFLTLKTPLKRLILSQIGKEPTVVEQLPGAVLMAPKGVWQKVGLLDEDYRFLYEDVDWSWRAKKMGVKQMVVPEAKIIHLGGGSWRQKLKFNSFEFYCDYFKALLLFVKKNYGRRRLRIFKKVLLLNFLLRFKFKLFNYFYILK